MVFANTTPILDERHAKRGGDFDRTEADVQRYNAAAIAVMKAEGIPVHDLHWVVEQHGVDNDARQRRHALHAAGYERLAEAVADCILRQLDLAQSTPLANARPATRRPATAYRKAEARARCPGSRRVTRS